MDPMNRIRVASLSYKQESVDRACIILFDPLAIVVFLLDDPDTCRCHVEGRDFILLHSIPNDSGVGYDRLSFEEDACRVPQKRSINDEAMTDDPANITACEVHRTWIDIEHRSHDEI